MFEKKSLKTCGSIGVEEEFVIGILTGCSRGFLRSLVVVKIPRRKDSVFSCSRALHKTSWMIFAIFRTPGNKKYQNELLDLRERTSSQRR